MQKSFSRKKNCPDNDKGSISSSSGTDLEWSLAQTLAHRSPNKVSQISYSPLVEPNYFVTEPILAV